MKNLNRAFSEFNKMGRVIDTVTMHPSDVEWEFSLWFFERDDPHLGT